MRTLPPGLQDRLDSGCTTLAHAWILRRADGLVLGFTDHDEDLTVAGIACRASGGFDASAAAEKLGFAAATADIVGALVDEAISEADIRAGRWDGATVEVHLVDWSEPSLTLPLASLTLGAVTREGPLFRAELRSRTAGLDVERGRLYTPRCTADLGDARCGVDLDAAGRRGEGTILAVETGVLTVAGLSGLAAEDLTGGRLSITGGPAEGFAVEIAAATAATGGLRLSLWQPPPVPPDVGDPVTVTVGCDKSFATCRDRFANGLAFRGFPHMPGIDRIISVPVAGEGGYDGTVVG